MFPQFYQFEHSIRRSHALNSIPEADPDLAKQGLGSRRQVVETNVSVQNQRAVHRQHGYRLHSFGPDGTSAASDRWQPWPGVPTHHRATQASQQTQKGSRSGQDDGNVPRRYFFLHHDSPGDSKPDDGSLGDGRVWTPRPHGVDGLCRHMDGNHQLLSGGGVRRHDPREGTRARQRRRHSYMLLLQHDVPVGHHLPPILPFREESGDVSTEC